MIKFLAIFVFLVLCSTSYSGGFYKWKDENGKVHITDYLPEGVETIEDKTKTSVNKVKMNTVPIQQSNNSNNLNNEFHRSENQNKNYNLDSEVIVAKNKYDFCMKDLSSRMTPRSDKSHAEHLERKKKCNDFYIEYVRLLMKTNDNEFINEKIDIITKKTPAPLQHVESPQQ